MIWMIIGFIALAGFLVYWIISSTMEEIDLWNKDCYIDAMNEIRRIERRWDSKRSSMQKEND